MPETPRPPAYIAAVTPLPLDSAPLRVVRLSARQHDALARLRVPIRLDGSSPVEPCIQAETTIRLAVETVLGSRRVSADLWRDEDTGDVSVWHDGTFIAVADVTLTPARAKERAA